MLLKEKLEDQGIKKVELDRSLVEKKLELMATLQQKLASVGRTDDKLDREIKTLAEQVAVWREADAANKPKMKKSAALNVMRT
jgi:septal ring factor EnvC (AmiA/AmiB activator)